MPLSQPIPPIVYPSPWNRYRGGSRSQSPIYYPIGNHSEGLKVIEDPLKQRFLLAQQERGRSFCHDEERRDISFREAESLRKRAEDERTATFESRNKEQASRFKEMLEQFMRTHRSQEQARNRNDSRRQEAFVAEEKLRGKMVEMLLFQDWQQAKAENDAEERLSKDMQDKIEAMRAMQDQQLSSVQKELQIRFEETQRRRTAELGVPYVQLVPYPQPLPLRRSASVPPQNPFTDFKIYDGKEKAPVVSVVNHIFVLTSYD